MRGARAVAKSKNPLRLALCHFVEEGTKMRKIQLAFAAVLLALFGMRLGTAQDQKAQGDQLNMPTNYLPFVLS